jgi:hypothetical protein
MTIYTAFEDGRAARAEAADRVTFVKDGFCWPALFFAVPWLLWHRMWWVLLGYLLVVIAIVLSMSPLGPGHSATVYALMTFAVLFALLANGFRRWTLERRGYRLAGVVQGRRLEDAERRFFERWTPVRRLSRPAGAPLPPAQPLGMFPGRSR